MQSFNSTAANSEAIITIVGFLGAGKTTLLKYLTTQLIDKGWSPFIILNDYENASLDAQQFTRHLDPSYVRALNGSCICCSGINELRDFVNRVPERENGITLIEANGTSDACSLMGFLGVGVSDRFLPPIQVSVLDVKNWQQRDEHNELEANQIQVSTLIVLTHLEKVPEDRRESVVKDIQSLNSSARILTVDDIDVTILSQLSPSTNRAKKLNHLKAHWSSCSTDLPTLPNQDAIYQICSRLPKTILRVKGCTKIGADNGYTYFERRPDGEVTIRPFNGEPSTGAKLLTIGPGSELSLLKRAVRRGLIV